MNNAFHQIHLDVYLYLGYGYETKLIHNIRREWQAHLLQATTSVNTVNLRVIQLDTKLGSDSSSLRLLPVALRLIGSLEVEPASSF